MKPCLPAAAVLLKTIIARGLAFAHPPRRPQAAKAAEAAVVGDWEKYMLDMMMSLPAFRISTATERDDRTGMTRHQ